jgi:[ribosomal protein S5]-alanine N-acetyltransferase
MGRASGRQVIDRVIILPIAPTDADELIRANRASTELHRPWVHPFTDRAGFQAYLDGLDGVRTVGLIARDMDAGTIVGVLTLSQIARGAFQSAYLGFYGAAGQVGHGRMTEAVRSAVAFAFHDLALHRLEANIQPGNTRSIALVRRVGFRKEGYSPRYLSIAGEWCDHERWAILADELPGDARSQ